MHNSLKMTVPEHQQTSSLPKSNKFTAQETQNHCFSTTQKLKKKNPKTHKPNSENTKMFIFERKVCTF